MKKKVLYVRKIVVSHVGDQRMERLWEELSQEEKQELARKLQADLGAMMDGDLANGCRKSEAP